mmetsp:Transcript_3852/g.10039  ORF Transcript_3852/g.10039 Transcript_3852/m.10039 type:complete len:243 (+) Transcript_3852:528-1256(+)
MPSRRRALGEVVERLERRQPRKERQLVHARCDEAAGKDAQHAPALAAHLALRVLDAAHVDDEQAAGRVRHVGRVASTRRPDGPVERRAPFVAVGHVHAAGRRARRGVEAAGRVERARGEREAEVRPLRHVGRAEPRGERAKLQPRRGRVRRESAHVEGRAHAMAEEGGEPLIGLLDGRDVLVHAFRLRLHRRQPAERRPLHEPTELPQLVRPRRRAARVVGAARVRGPAGGGLLGAQQAHEE